MIRQIRVIMSLAAEGMIGGIRNVVRQFADLGSIITGLRNAFDMLSGAARQAWDLFIEGALADERLSRQFSILAGSVTEGANILAQLEKYALDSGLAVDDVTAAASEIAPAIKASEGKLDPGKLIQYIDVIRKLALSTGRTIPEIASAFTRAITGDVETLRRALGLSQEALASMSPEFQKFLQGAQGAQGAQLGEVTRLGERTTTAGGDALKMMEELAAALDSAGIAEEAFATGYEDDINRFNDALDELKDTIGADLLPVLIPLLQDVTQWLKDNPKAIEQLVKTLGSFSATAWQDLATALLTIQMVISSAEFRAFLGMMAGGPFTAAPIPSLLGGVIPLATSGSPQPLAQIPGPQSLAPILDALVNQLAAGIKVQIGVDDDGKIKAVAENAATTVLSDFVKTVTAGKGHPQ